MIEIREEGDAAHLVVVASGRLSEEDYRGLVPRLHEAIERHGGLRLLILLRDFEGWAPKALIEDLPFDLRHRKDFERVAIVGDRRWEEIGTRIAAPFFSGSMRFFEDEADARVARLTHGGGRARHGACVCGAPCGRELRRRPGGRARGRVAADARSRAPRCGGDRAGRGGRRAHAARAGCQPALGGGGGLRGGRRLRRGRGPAPLARAAAARRRGRIGRALDDQLRRQRRPAERRAHDRGAPRWRAASRSCWRWVRSRRTCRRASRPRGHCGAVGSPASEGSRRRPASPSRCFWARRSDPSPCAGGLSAQSTDVRSFPK